MSLLSKKIGIDLGSSTVLIYVKGEGIVVNERCDEKRTLGELIGKANGRRRLFGPEVVVSVPSAVGSGERRAVAEAAMAAGARQVWLIDDPLAAAMGAGLPIAEARASAICDMGAATTEIAVISLSGMVVSRSIPVGGDSIDDAIAEHVRRTHGLVIDRRAAEEVKLVAGSAVEIADPLVAQIGTHDISSNEIAEAIQQPLRSIVGAIRQVLEETPPELATDVTQRGIVLCGGGAQLRGLAGYVSHHTGIPAFVADEPQTSVVRGAALALESFAVLKQNQSYLR
jgi:rod shape-determining protein MreB